MSSWQDLKDFVESHRCQWSLHPDEGEWGIHLLDTPPHNRLLGPVFPRGDTAGMVSIGGELQCSWGDTSRTDMTFSVTKTYLAMVAGIAVGKGLIKNVDEPVQHTLSRHGLECDSFNLTHNCTITWRHFLQFTSEWSGDCFGIPDQVDHYRSVSMQPPETGVHNKGDKRDLSAPGTHWEYNDVRINQCALLRYSNSDVALSDGTLVKSVPGGGHWGGGMVISVEDQLLIAQLLLNSGSFHGDQILPADWVEEMTRPCNIAPWYGYYLWLNTDRVVSRAASEKSFFAMGIGGQFLSTVSVLHLSDQTEVA